MIEYWVELSDNGHRLIMVGSRGPFRAEIPIGWLLRKPGNEWASGIKLTARLIEEAFLQYKPQLRVVN